MILKKIFEVIREWRMRGQIRQELYRMSDQQLADIGLTREDIDSVADGTFNRPAYH